MQLNRKPRRLRKPTANLLLIKRIKHTPKHFRLQKLCIRHNLIYCESQHCCSFHLPAIQPTRLNRNPQLLPTQQSHNVFDLMRPLIRQVYVDEVGQRILVDCGEEVGELLAVGLVEVG